MEISDLTKGFCIYMLPAFEGDCLYIQIPLENNKFFRIIIDCGPPKCWQESLRPFLDLILEAKVSIDLLILTHIDGDHIGGAISLFSEAKYAHIINEVWFNSLYQLLPQERSITVTDEKLSGIYRRVVANHIYNQSSPSEKISSKQAVSISEKIVTQKVPWNAYTDGEAISARTESYQISPDVYIDFLLPHTESLQRLLALFKKEVNAIKMGTAIVNSPTSGLAFEQTLLCAQGSPVVSSPICHSIQDISDIAKLANKRFSEDTSITNRSSIAVCIRYYNHALLFPGDAYGSELITALDQWSVKYKRPLDFDVVKLPHHGSAHNCMNLLDHIRSSIFLVSTDGSKYSHPDISTIAKLIEQMPQYSFPSKTYFNYKSEAYCIFAERYAKDPIFDHFCVTNDKIPLFYEV